MPIDTKTMKLVATAIGTISKFKIVKKALAGTNLNVCILQNCFELLWPNPVWQGTKLSFGFFLVI